MTPLDFWTTCSANDIMIDKDQVDALERYQKEIIYWNKKVNMISRKDEDHIWDRHLLHALTLLKYCDIPKRARILDVGTGGGLPGIPIKIARPDVKMLLVDSIGKKASMTDMFAQHTMLKDITTLNARVETLAQDAHYRLAFDVIISRAVATTNTLISWISPLLKKNGYCAFLKGGDLTAEIEEAMAHHSDLQVQEIPINMFGAPWFAEDQKKVVVCRLS